jgi:hypothetical protein
MKNEWQLLPITSNIDGLQSTYNDRHWSILSRYQSMQIDRYPSILVTALLQSADFGISPGWNAHTELRAQRQRSARESGRQVECPYRVAGRASALGAGSDIPKSAYCHGCTVSARCARGGPRHHLTGASAATNADLLAGPFRATRCFSLVIQVGQHYTCRP